MKIFRAIIFILLFQTFNYCHSQSFAPVGIGGTSTNISKQTQDIIATGILSGTCVTVSVINCTNFFNHKKASSNAPFGIALGIFQIVILSQLPSDEKTFKTINIVSGGCLIATSILRLYTFKKDANTALNLNLIPSTNGNLFVGLRFSHTFN